MKIGIPKESFPGETRVAATPESSKKLIKKGFELCVEKGAGSAASFTDAEYEAAGVKVVDQNTAYSQEIVFKVQPPTDNEISQMKKGSLLISFLEPFRPETAIQKLATHGIDAMSMELIPRTSRAQSMDALSSQANIAGYRAVLEAGVNYKRFFPLMMTSAGMSKPAKLVVLGAGVAGLQAIATARRLGAQVEAFDIRPEVKEQILSLGAKFIDIDVGEEGSGQGGYAKELSEAAKQRQQQALADRLKKADIIITTANVPGRRAPILIPEETVKGMKPGSVIIDMAAPSGGNCPLTEKDKTVVRHGVTLVGHTNIPALIPADSSYFYAHNLIALISLVVQEKDGKLVKNLNLEDDIIAACLVSLNGDIRLRRS